MNFPGRVIIKIISILFGRQGPEFIFILINWNKYWNKNRMIYIRKWKNKVIIIFKIKCKQLFIGMVCNKQIQYCVHGTSVAIVNKYSKN